MIVALFWIVHASAQGQVDRGVSFCWVQASSTSFEEWVVTAIENENLQLSALH